MRAFSSCSAWASPCCGFPCCGALAPGTQASEVVAHGLSCSTACGLFPDQGSNRSHLHWQVDSYPLNHQRRPWAILRTENLSKMFSGKQKCLQFVKILGKSDSLIGCNFKACLHDLFFFLILRIVLLIYKGSWISYFFSWPSKAKIKEVQSGGVIRLIFVNKS